MRMICGVLGIGLLAASVAASAVPVSVTVVGSLQSEVGCVGDWNPACAATHLAYDPNDDVWQGTFALPAGPYEYKATLNDDWTVNYGANAVAGGSNIGLAVPSPATVKFYYDDKSHWITDNVNSLIAVLAGDFQSELGCAGDWDPSCLRSWLQDIDGDGIYTFSALLSSGDYYVKVAMDEAWNVNFGADGQQGGANISFSSVVDSPTVFSFCSSTHVLAINASCSAGIPESVPEPGTAALLAFGLMALGLATRRKAAVIPS